MYRFGKFRLQKFVRSQAHGLSRRKAIQLFRTAVPQHDAIVHVAHHHLGQFQHARLLAQSPVTPFPFGHIAYDSGIEFAAAAYRLGNRRLNGKFLAVGAQSFQCAQGPHGAAGNSGFAEGLDMFSMGTAKAFRNETVQRTPQRVRGRALEHLLCCRIEHDHLLS